MVMAGNDFGTGWRGIGSGQRSIWIRLGLYLGSGQGCIREVFYRFMRIAALLQFLTFCNNS
jgi:hypothetical protein